MAPMQPANALHFALDDRINDVPVDPGHVPLALLGQFHHEVTDFLTGSQHEIDPASVIVSIQPGSLMLVASGLLAASGLWADIQQLQNPAALGLIDPKRATVVERWQKAARAHPHRSYRLADARNLALIRVDSASDFRNQVEAAWVAVEKHLSGIVVDWGGKTRANVHLDTADAGVLTIAASQHLLAAEPENRLYKPAMLHVAAEENLRNGQLRNLRLLGFVEHAAQWDAEAFARQVDKGTQAWANVPDGWLEELRREPA